MTVVFGGVSPHPPIIVPAVGGRELPRVQKTLDAMRAWAKECLEQDPDTVIIISPHGPVFQDAIAVTAFPRLRGDLARFNAPEVKAEVENDLPLLSAVIDQAKRHGVSIAAIDDSLAERFSIENELDHGTMVPLYFLLEAGFRGKVVPVAMALLPREELFRFGIALREAIDATPRRVALIASSDLSHRLTKDAPAGYHPEAHDFDKAIERAFGVWELDDLLTMEESLCEKAGECGYRPLLMLAGAFDRPGAKSRVYSYEGPFGVGYLVGSVTDGGEAGEASAMGEGRLARYIQGRRDKIERSRAGESIYVRFARQTLEAHVAKEPLPPIPAELATAEPAGVFVSIKMQGQLRGCIGTIEPTRESLGEEIRQNAISAGANDPRFFPVEEDELDELVYSVDVLMPEEPIQSTDELDPQRYGVIVRAGRQQGLLLPMLDGVDTVEEQVRIARQKAGIPEGKAVDLSRFEVVRHH
ncbi:AmmeMemoRadiSam system protein A [Heliobacterium gestii]|uniref:AmmeMemoRadiSam system protein A n=1 Tax=Heliomicrobium gestii TaxID=2699 RepID=A0A845L9V9_HELGE|nr:AmmeMemoRadiSam system protein A [Heliomicrobium gestii]MBM7865823.1 AmmeMemoRadiSam system protein A/AmmeMemoRadiSam system protein B [Heliomicrobium gestii]MZP42064.1 AmmeMemoRadiSam system protein A [Heliomicrobium gestii]